MRRQTLEFSLLLKKFKSRAKSGINPLFRLFDISHSESSVKCSDIEINDYRKH